MNKEKGAMQNESEYSGYRGLKIISPNKEYYVIDRQITRGHVVHEVEAVGENWIVSKGENLVLTEIDDVVGFLNEHQTKSGEPGAPLNQDQKRQLMLANKLYKKKRSDQNIS